MRYRIFKANYSLNIEKKKTEQLYEETRTQNEDLNQKNEEITAQKDEIELQKSKLERSHKNITDSINYASRIQTAMLPRKSFFKEHFSDYFILYKPRNVVSGDFYWAKKIDNTLIFAAADSTGHGVPGAFVSMLGMSLLNDIVTKQKTLSSNVILNDLRIAIKTSLKQSNEKTSTKDGMDIALCVLNLDTNKLQFSGAYNPLYIIRNNELIQIKADRQPIAIYIKEKEFTKNKFQLQKNDILYLFSDGFTDQFGCKDLKKFNSKRFREILLANTEKELFQQKQILDNAFIEWKGSRDQIDDIVILGMKI